MMLSLALAQVRANPHRHEPALDEPMQHEVDDTDPWWDIPAGEPTCPPFVQIGPLDV